jgi:hypothetical protein
MEDCMTAPDREVMQQAHGALEAAIGFCHAAVQQRIYAAIAALRAALARPAATPPEAPPVLPPVLPPGGEQPHITALLAAHRDLIEAQQRGDREAESAAVRRMEAARSAADGVPPMQAPCSEEPARTAFEQDARTRYPGLRLIRHGDGYVNPGWDERWRFWLRAWNAAVGVIGEQGGKTNG